MAARKKRNGRTQSKPKQLPTWHGCSLSHSATWLTQKWEFQLDRGRIVYYDSAFAMRCAMIELRQWKIDKFCSSHGTVDTSRFFWRTQKDTPKILLTCNSHAQDKLNWSKGSKHLGSHVTQCNKVEQANQEKNEKPAPSFKKKNRHISRYIICKALGPT
jgi:hypothetical protein